MTHTEDLIARLRDTASRGVSSWEEDLTNLLMESYDKGVENAIQEAMVAFEKTVAVMVAAEREACAKLCDDNADIEHWQDEKSGGIRTGLHAKLIRARDCQPPKGGMNE
jgi:hypothetical protein